MNSSVYGRHPVSGNLVDNEREAVDYGKKWQCPIVRIGIEDVYTPISNHMGGVT